MRDYAILMMQYRKLQEVVTCSLPFRLTKRRYVAIEINPRVSRSALASKATGYLLQKLL
jgi:carbamoylphosphate synthase large subunit